MMDPVIITCHCNTSSVDKVVREILNSGFAASIDLLPSSWDMWYRKMDGLTDVRSTLLITTDEGAVDSVIEKIQDILDEVPVITEFPIHSGYDVYIKWIEEQLGMGFSD